VFRKSVEQRPSGALVLVDNRDGFLEHPEPLAVDQILAEIKRFSRFPRGLVQALDALNEHRLEEALQSGPFDDWLVHRRPRRELLIRARMLASLVRVRREARGDEVLLDD
jgi:transposase